MAKIAIQLPYIDADDIIEIEIRVNGKKKRYHYRIEKLEWHEDTEPHDVRIAKLKKTVEEYDQDWQLIQIGTPQENFVPLTFRQMH